MHSLAIQQAAAELRKEFADPPTRKVASVLAYAASLTLSAIPGLTIAGAIIDRGLADAQLNRELTALWEMLAMLNRRIGQLADLESEVAEIAATVERNADLQPRMLKLLSELGQLQSEFSVLSENESFQHFQHVLIEQERVAFTATGAATNRLEDVEVRSKSITMHTADRGTNDVVNASFRHGPSTLHAHGVTQVGEVEITPQGIAMRADPQRAFSGIFQSANAVLIKRSMPCPSCGQTISPNPDAMYSFLGECPHCKAPLAGRI